MKKRRIAVSVVVVLLLLMAFGLGYQAGLSHARKAPREIVAKDTADGQQSSGKAEYDPYFAKQNQIDGRVK
jgi:hypothetical protein